MAGLAPPVGDLAGALLEAHPAPVLLADPDLRVLGMNGLARELLGHAPEGPGRLAALEGERLHCLEAALPGGCPRQARCHDCAIMDAVAQAVTGGTTHVAETRMELHGEDGPREVALLVRAVPVVHGDQTCALVTLEPTGGSAPLSRPRHPEAAEMEQARAFRQFTNSAPVAMAMFDREMRYLTATRRWLADYQLTGRDLAGLCQYDLFPAMSEAWRQAHRRALAGEVVHCEAERLELPGGRVEWLRWAVHPWPHLDASIGGVIIFSEYVTEAVRAKEADRERVEWLRLVQGVAEFGTWEWVPASGVVTSSEEMRRIGNLEWTGDAVPVGVLWSAVLPEDREPLRRVLDEAVPARKGFEAEFRVQAGAVVKRVMVRGRIAPARPGRGGETRYLGIVLDVSGRRAAEEEVRAAAELLEHGEPFAELDASWRFVRVNTRFAQLSLRPRDELVGKEVWALFPGAFGDLRLRQELFRCMRDRVPVEHEGYYEPLGLWVSIHGYPAGRGGVAMFIRDVTERRKAEEALRRSRRQLRELMAHQEGAREDESARIARELHDELGQLLTALRFDLEAIEEGLSTPPAAGDVPRLLDRAVDASEVASQAVEALRRVVSGLRPAALDRLGLGPALRDEGRRFQERSGVRCTVEVPDARDGYGRAVETALFRIAQEALTNVGRHAGASRVAVALAVEPGAVVLRIQDDGQGFDPGRVAPRSMGLIGMRERAERLGGSLTVGPGRQGGTEVRARLPLG